LIIKNCLPKAILKYKSAVQAGIAQQPERLVEEEVVQKKDELKEEIVAQKEIELPVESSTPPVQEELKETIPMVVKKEPEEKEVDKTVTEAPVQKTEEEAVVVAPIAKSDKPVSKPQVNFKVQIMASAKDLDLKPQNFKGLGRISKEPYKNLYRYMYGVTNSYKEAEMLKSEADIKGYTSSYIVAYKEGVRIPLTEALKSVSE
jgi:N-acetylmuramoyl-L-alanine amidase